MVFWLGKGEFRHFAIGSLLLVPAVLHFFFQDSILDTEFKHFQQHEGIFKCAIAQEIRSDHILNQPVLGLLARFAIEDIKSLVFWDAIIEISRPSSLAPDGSRAKSWWSADPHAAHLHFPIAIRK